MICPKCGYKRTTNDDPLIPDYQCPACGIIYEKYQQQSSTIRVPDNDKHQHQKPNPDSRIRHPKLIKFLCFLVVIAWLYKCSVDHEESRKAADRKQAEAEYKQLIKKSAQQARRSEFEKNLQAYNENCIKDAVCTGQKLLISSGHDCQNRIEHLSRYSFKWTDGWFGQKFNLFAWKDSSKSSIIAFGDKIELQNGFGAWQNHIYTCEVRVSDGAVIDAGARPGRL